jgi:hypothetical protein
VRVFLVTWECGWCGQKQSFRQSVNEDDGWPNKFELTCRNTGCEQQQDVPFRACAITPIDSE